MDSHSLHGPVKVVALLVLALMFGAVVYAGYMAVSHWSGIGV